MIRGQCEPKLLIIKVLRTQSEQIEQWEKLLAQL